MMNAFEAAKRLFVLSENLEKLSVKMGNTERIDERERIEKDINILEVEFFTLKYLMEKKTL